LFLHRVTAALKGKQDILSCNFTAYFVILKVRTIRQKVESMKFELQSFGINDHSDILNVAYRLRLRQGQGQRVILQCYMCEIDCHMYDIDVGEIVLQVDNQCSM